MTALPARTNEDTAPDGAVFEAVGDALALASGYLDIAGRAVELRDAKVLGYSIRCASASIVAAAELVAEMPSNHRRAS